MTRRNILELLAGAADGVSAGDAPTRKAATVFRGEHLEGPSPDGREILLFQPNPVVEYYPSIEPRGAETERSSRLRIVDPGGAREVQGVTVPATTGCQAAWTPDGKEVLFSPLYKTPQEIFRWARDGGSPVRIIPQMPKEKYWWFRPLTPVSMICAAHKPESVDLVRMNVRTGIVEQRKSIPARSISSLEVSKDGKTAAMVEFGGSGRAVILETAEFRPILELPKPPRGIYSKVMLHPSTEFILAEIQELDWRDLELRRARDGALIRRLGVPAAVGNWLSFSGNLILQGVKYTDKAGKTTQGEVQVVDVLSGRSLHRFAFDWTRVDRRNPWSATVNRAATLYDGKVVASTGYPETRVFWGGVGAGG